MRNQKKKIDSFNNLHPEDKAMAAASLWDLMWLVEALEMIDADDLAPLNEEGDVNVPEYVSKYGISDAELRR